MFKSFDALELKSSELEGRYLIATRDIEIGEDILKCKSYFAVTSETLKKISCFNCIKQQQQPSSQPSQKSFTLKCNECNEIWYCSDKCKQQYQAKHLHYECKFYKKLKSPKLINQSANFKFEDIETFTEIRMIIGLLSRYYKDILLNNKFQEVAEDETEDEDDKDRLTNSLEDVFDLVENIVTNESNIFAKELIDQITDYIKGLLKLVLVVNQDQDEEEEREKINKLNELIKPLIHKTRCNQFGIWTKNDKCIGVAVSPSSSYFNHSCIPNCTDIRDGSKMTFKSLYPIKKGDQLTISYIELDQTVENRRDELKFAYHFICNCSRCSSTESDDSLDNKISKFYCNQKKCTGLYYSKNRIQLSSNLDNNNHQINLACSNCNNTLKVLPSFFF